MFKNRVDAGEHLAELLQTQNLGVNGILGIARGGIPVAEIVARRLQVPLDMVITHKVTTSTCPEVTVGAVAEDGAQAWDEDMLRDMGVSSGEMESAAQSEIMMARRRRFRLGGGDPVPSLAGRRLLLVDDGLVTGVTMEAAVRMVQAGHSDSVVAAVPVTSDRGLLRLQRLGISVLFLKDDPGLTGLSRWYENFRSVSEDQVTACLERARTRRMSNFVRRSIHILSAPCGQFDRTSTG
jgi:predicted phosphoribosyltransferase